MGRTEKSIKNIAFGLGSQAVITLVNFVTKSVIARLLGDQIVAMNGLFIDVIACLSLAELGIGSAIVYNLYKPLAEDDREKVCQLMSFYKQAYLVIAGVLLTLGGIGSIFVKYIVKDITYPMWFVRVIFILFVINSASSYLFSYKITLLNADQKAYVNSFFTTIFYVIKTGINIGVLFLINKYGDDYSYIIYLVIVIITNLISNMFISRQVDKRYTYLKKAKLPKEDRDRVFDNVKNIFVKELSGKITSSTDNILISVMVSTIMVAPNQFYTMLTGVFKSIISQVEVGIRASMGNMFATENGETCERVINRLTWGYGIFAIWCSVGLYVCADPFITVWVGAKYLYSKYILFILAINLFCFIVSRPIYDAMSAAGLFVQGRNISIYGSIVNLVVSIIFGKFFGVFGIFLGTFCTYFIQIVMKTYYVHKLIIHKSAFKYGMKLIMYTLFAVGFMFGGEFICSLLPFENNIVCFVFNGLIISALYFVFVFVVYNKSDEYQYFWSLLKNRLLKKH